MSLLSRSLCAALALSLVCPPNALLLAQDRPGDTDVGPQDEADHQRDLRGLDVIDVDPLTGALLYAREDLRLGEGDLAFEVVRTYRPWAGDALNMGTHWVSVFDAHLDVHPSRERAAFTGEDGRKVFFQRGEDGKLHALTGAPAVVELFEDGFTLTGLGHDRTWRFDAQGWPLARTGPRGLSLEFKYDGERRLTQVKGPWGALALERDGEGALAALVTPGGARVRYARDEQGNLSFVQKGALRESYDYDGAGRLTGLAGGQARVGYDVLGRVLSLSGDGVEGVRLRYLGQAGGAGAPLGQAIDPSQGSGREVHVERGGERWAITVSADGRRIERTNDRGETTLTELDARDRPVRLSVDGDGELRAWTFEYDPRGRLLKKTGPEGETTFEYAARVTDKPTRVGLPDGREVTFTYDLHGNLLEEKAPGGASTRFGYDAAGRLQTVTDARGGVTRFTLDERGLVSAQEEDGVGRTLFQRDADGLIVKIKRPDGRVVDVVRDDAGRARRVSDALGVVRAVDYDARGNVVASTDELGQTFRYGYDERGRLLSVDDAMGQVARLRYDEGGRLAAFVDALGNQTTLERPDARTVVVTDPASGARVLRHDAFGQLAEETRGAVTVRYGRDGAGRITSRETPRGTDTFTYEKGRLTAMSGPDGGFGLRYDEAGRLAALLDTNTGKQVTYGYSPAGDRTSLGLPWGKVTYEVDGRGRVTGVGLPEGGTIAIELHPDGRRKEVRYPNGVVTRFGYQRARLTEVVTVKGEQVLDRRAYGYDEQGRVAWSEDTQGRTTYTHDARGRLTAAAGPGGTVSWTYDAAGNRLTETRGAGATRYEVGAGNRITAAGGETLTHTATGALAERRTTTATTRFAYDHDDRLVSTTTSDGATVRYGYAPNGARLWREEGGVRTSYLHDLADVVGELDPQGQVVTSYVHGPGVDDVLSARHGEASFFYHWDLVRNVTALTDAQGAVAARYAYDAFGAATAAEGPAAAWNPLRFGSRPWDAAAGLYDLRARTYAPDLGRFTSPDPMGVLGGVNLYAYVENDPTLFNDPFGLQPWYSRLWEGTRNVASGVASWAGGITKADVVDGLKYVGRQTWAFTRGFGKGLWNAGKGIVNMALHPVDTIDGIVYAVEHWDETKEALLAKWEEYKDAARNDPEKFAEMTGMLTAEVVVSIAGTKGLDKLAKANFVAASVRRVAGVSRVAGSPVTRLASRAGTSLASRFPRTAEVLRRARVLDRARNVELARRAAQPGNVLARGGRRVVDLGRDVGRAGRLAVREPGAFLVYSGRRLTRAGASLVGAVGRGVWTSARRFTIPTVITFDDAITDAIDKHATHESASTAVRDVGGRLLDDVARLSPEELVARIDEVGRTYRDYRNRLLAPIHDEDRRLEASLADLNARVERGEIPDNTLDARLEAALTEYGRRRHNLMVDLYERGRDVEHDMLSPSPNRALSFDDEVALLTAARDRCRDAECRALFDARIADLTALRDHEVELFRAGEHDALIAGIAGPPRLPGETVPTPAAVPTTDPAGTSDDARLGDSMDGLIDTRRD